MSASKPRLVLAGGNGFLGTVLAGYFGPRGWDVVIFTRKPSRDSSTVRQVAWDGQTPGPWVTELENARALVNLCGVSVNCRYHARNRKRIIDSRIDPTRALGAAIESCAKPPEVWLNASTATIYKHTFGPAWDESGEIGATPDAKDEFSIDVATAWERTFTAFSLPKTRKVLLRSAMVLGTGRNSVVAMMRRLTRLGLGGSMAGGHQFASWVHEQDFARAVEWIIEHTSLDGPINIAAPTPVTNEEMMRTFREICGRRMGLPASRWMLEVGAFFLRTETELIIKSRRVVPGRLLSSGFEFRFPKLHAALQNLR
jgi:uncharacterized protein (TIGR01777 family)